MKESNQFKALLDELETMSKAQGTDDQRIENAAGEGADTMSGGADTITGGSGNDTMAGGGGAEEEPFGKSFKVMVDGKEVDAFDGTEIMKSLWARNQALESTVGTLSVQNQDLSDALTRSLELSKDLRTTVTNQGDMLKSLRTDLDALRNQGAGRRAVVTVLDKPGATPMAKALDGVQPRELLSKALSAQRAGRMTAKDVTLLETHINRGEAPPARLVELAMSPNG